MTPDVKISMDNVVESPKVAKIHDFIMTLPQKYGLGISLNSTELNLI